MAYQLGSITYTAVVWTSGDIITEAKMDNMVANDQAYDSHASEGLLLNNNRSLAGKDSGGTIRNIIKVTTDDKLEVGDADINDFEIASDFTKTKASYSAWVSASDGATITFDMSLGNKQKVTLGGNRTLALSNVKEGMGIILRLTQDATGSRTVTWFSTITWDAGVTPTLTTTANKTDVFALICTGSGTYDGFVLGQNL